LTISSPSSGAISERTEVLHGEQIVVNTVLQFTSKAKSRNDACIDYTRPSLIVEIEQLRKAFIDARSRGVRLRYVTEITEDNIVYCKELMKMVDELRHVEGIKGNFYISETEYIAPASLHKKGKPASQIIYSNVKEIVEQQQYVFDSFWDKSISAERKIREIENEDSISLGETEVIDNPLKTQELFINLIKSAKSEVLLILPTVNAFMREYRIGAINLLKELSTKNNERIKTIQSLSAKETLQQGGESRREDVGRQMGGINVRVLTPTNETINKILHEMNIAITTTTTNIATSSSSSISTTKTIQEAEFSPSYFSSKNGDSLLQIRYLESLPKYNLTTVTILVVDRKSSLVIEKVDDYKESFAEAVGLSTYSTSKPTIMSYVSVFENFWNQIELYRKLKDTGNSLAKSNKQLEEANEQLKVHDRMQKQFINIAAHELKTPTQGILGFSNLLKRYPEKRQELTEAICRNATRLHRLISDILDVTKIESQNLKLEKEQLNLYDLLTDVVNDYKSQIGKSGTANKPNVNLLILYENPSEDYMVNQIFVEADKIRLTQVISNLLNNAIKFTKEGTIAIVIKKSSNSYEAIVSIKDTGSGIHPDIMHRLFEKFASKSYQGTGLGLFISKAIVEAHGGRIWAQNNDSNDSNVNSKKGATFTFTLPLVNEELTR
jgi:two-component system sensor histidine kinase VicK